MKAYLEEIRLLAQDLSDGSVGVRGVLDQFKLWPTNSAIRFCFNEGQRLRNLFVRASLLWTSGTSLKFDFGDAPEYRTCKPDDQSQIRVSFDGTQNWSFIGTDSLRVKNTTLNIAYGATTAIHMVDLSYFNELVLHEVGHAIGFEHEHQSPEGKCEQEFDWPKVYEFARTEWGWVTPKGEVDKQIVDVNMRALSSAERLRITPYDRGSIMHYYFEPELFKRGRNSHCFVGHNKVLSRTDRELAREAYPPEVTMQDGHLQKRADVASAILAPMKLTAPQLSRVGREVGRVLAAAPRKVTLDFDLARGAGKPSTRGGGGDPLEPCGSADQLSDAKMDVACGVAADASVLVVAVEPK